MDQNKKSKAFIQSFKEQVAQGRQQAEETLARLKQDLSVSPLTASTHLPPKPITNQSQSPSTKPPAPIDETNLCSDTSTTLHTAAAQALSPKDHPLFAQTQHLLRLSHAVLRCHQTVDTAASRTPPDLASPRETWRQDEEGMRQLLAYGRVHGERAVEGWIAPQDSGEEQHEVTDEEEEGDQSEEERERRREAENLARGLFEWRRKGRGLGLGESEESWGVAARRQMGALVGVVRTLPSSKGGK